MISSQATRVHGDSRIPWMLMQLTLTSSNGTGSSSPRDGCFKCGGVHFQRDCNARKAQASNRMAKANRASHGPRVSPHNQAKERVRKTWENAMEPKVQTRCQRGFQRQTSKAGLSSLGHSGICTDMLPRTFLGTRFGSVTNGTIWMARRLGKNV